MIALRTLFATVIFSALALLAQRTLAQTPPKFSVVVLPTNPIAFDSITARVSSLNPCSIDERSVRVSQVNGQLRVSLNALGNCVPTGGGISFDVSLGKLPAGNYSVSVVIPVDNVVASSQFTVGSKSVTDIHPLVDYTDHWWNSSESGWGMSIMQHASDKLFAVWYVYDQNRQPVWFALQPGSWTAFNTFSGPVYKTSGPYFGGSFDPTTVGIAQVGTAKLQFSTEGSGEFTYSIEGVTGTKLITRMPY